MERAIVVAHRALHDGPAGAPGARAPENTVGAIEAAAAAGADAVELDVRSTRDGQLVLGHDPVQWAVRGAWRLPYLVVRSTRRSLPLLSGLSEAVEAALAAGLGVKLDVKDARALVSVAGWCRRGDVDPARVALWCRSPQRIAALPGRRDFAEVALLSNDRHAPGYVAAAATCGATAVSFHPRALSAAAVSAAHERGLAVYAWILDPSRHRVAVDLGVDGLVTDWVGQARSSLGPADPA